ncbi:C40 family peptidase [Streptomyces hygroscopicus]|uniref:C40 family peptidase n=1 Tax=Streptomyces hygroscopicus TaxID=1912 RepID=UPI000766F063|nr:C40 family peptidase [Streptomyces hygroscopicus]
MKKTGAAIALAAVSPLLLIVPVMIGVGGEASATCSAADSQEVGTGAINKQVKSLLKGDGNGSVPVSGLSHPKVQIPNAKTIQATGVALKIPARGQIVALATSLQESGLRNLKSGDRDSLGLFQQRPSQGWGTAEQVRDPVYASTQFYRHLQKVSGWESMTITQAAQAVQRSGYPEAYAKWEPLATALQQAIAETLPRSKAGSSADADGSTEASGASDTCDSGEDGSGFGAIPAGSLPDGYELPKNAPDSIRTAIRWALGQLGTPYQWGGHCTAPHGQDAMGRCDCSSLMQAAYKAGRVRLSRTTYTQVKDGKAVSVTKLRPGDLLFTEGAAKAPEHVGMYIGSGLIIHAPHTGDVVRIATLADWKPDILTVRRVA